MKIFILTVPNDLQPTSQSLAYPPHNEDYGVEQDFHIWLLKQPMLTTSDLNEADWHYLPVYWTRWHINHNFAAANDGIDRLNSLVNKCIVDPGKTFTISQFDGGTLLKHLGLLEFTAARTRNKGIDIPILCTKHKGPMFPITKKYLASFNGSFETHPIRKAMKALFESRNDVLIGGNLPTPFFKRMVQGKQFNLNTLASYIALCPRGTSCNSFRFFEAMQLGVAPCLIGDQDVRPFKEYVDWASLSYYVRDLSELNHLLLTIDKDEAIRKGKRAKKFFYQNLYYQKWCQYVIKELKAYATT